MHRAHAELALRAAKDRRSESLDSSRRRHDQARRRGLLHPRTLLSVTAAKVPCRHSQAFVAAVRNAHGRPA